MLNEDKSARYHRLRRRADLLGTVSAGLFLLALLLSGGAFRLREASSNLGTVFDGYEETGTVATFAVVLVLLLQLIELPFAYYQGFLLEHRFGLSNQRAKVWLVDQGKALALAMLFGAAAASTVYWTIRTFPDAWWAVAAAVFALFTLGMAQLAPVLLLPLFYSFKPLERPALVGRLTTLATRARTRIRGVYEWALSAHTKKANAALAGLGRTRRILLSDTLLADYSDDEIEVVLAHELSHHVHHDLWRGLALQAALLFAGFYVAAQALAGLAAPLSLRGVDDPAGLPVLMLAAGTCSLLFMPLANAVSRAHERRADRYALDITQRADAFISAMKRLSQQNLAEENPSRLVQVLFYSHPPIRERIDAARRWASNSQWPMPNSK